MHKSLLKIFWVSFAIFTASCGSRNAIIPETQPVFYLVLPSGTEQWKTEIISGFQQAANQFQMQHQTKTYTKADEINLVVSSIPFQDNVPICLVTPNDELAGTVCETQSKLGRRIITLLCSDGKQPKTAHVGMSPERLVELWNIRAHQLSKTIKKPLFVFGDEPVQTERLVALFFKNSDDWKKYRPTFKELKEVTIEDFQNADFVTTFGHNATQYAIDLLVKNLLPISLDDETLKNLRNGDIKHAIGADYFQVGLRAFRIARDAYLQGFPTQPITMLPYKESDVESVDFYKSRRYKLPPISIFAKPKN